MDTTAFAKLSLEQSFNLLNATLNDMNDEQYNFDPPGTANSAAKSHVHIVSAIDFFINALVAGGEASWGAFAQKHDLPANPTEIWGHTSAIPLAAMREFTSKVTSTALENVAKLTESDFDRELETRVLGKQTVAFMVQLTCLHTNGHGGDIACVKGMQGLKGLPF